MPSVLIVDDEAAIRELIGHMLAGREYRTLEARTAEAALDLLELTPEIHVVIADLHMPGRGGVWLVNQIQQRFPAVAIILATADDRVPGTVSLQPSVTGYLVKPLSNAQLIAAVEEALAWHGRQATFEGTGAADPYEPWLNRKLTRRPGGSGSP